MLRPKPWLILVALAALATHLPQGHADPRDTWSLEARVPASSLAFLSVEDVGGMQAKLEKTALVALFREPEMQAFLAPVAEALQAQFAAPAGPAGPSPLGQAGPLVMKLVEQLQGLQGQLAVAVLDMDMGSGMPSVAMSMDFGPNVGAFARFLEGMRQEVDPSGEAIRAFEKDGRMWWQVQDGPPITATTVDTAFVLATSPVLLDGVLAGGGEGNLGGSKDFQAVRAKAGGDQLALLAYANVPALVGLLGREMDDETRQVANALGLDTVRAAAYGMAFSGDGFMDSFILHAPGATHGLVPLVQMPPYRPRALSRVPSGAVYYEEGAVDYAALLSRVRTLVAGIEPSMVGEMDRALEEASSHLGVDIEDDVLGGLAGGAATYVAMPETGGLYPEIAMMLEVKDPGAYEQTFSRLMRGIAGLLSEQGDVVASTRTMDYKGTTLHLLDLQEARGDDVIPFTPTWAVIDGWLVITLVPHAMKEIVLRGQTTTGGGLASQEDFQALQRVMPPEAGGMSYLDLQGILGLLYDTAVPLLQTAAKPNVIGREIPFELDWAKLPAARTVRPHLRSLGVFTTWNEDGLAIQMHGPVPMAGLFVVAATVAGPALMLSRASSPPRRMPPPGFGNGDVGLGPRPGREDAEPADPKQRMARVRAEQIGSYVRVYLLTKDKLPSTLDDLLEENMASRLPDDPWGNAYRLVVLDEKERRFLVRSAGPDGSFGTEDDVDSTP